MVLSSLGAAADETITQTAPSRDRGQLLVAAKIGGLFSEPFSKLGASYLVDVEIGYALPVLEHRLAIAIDGAYTAPESDGSGINPQIANGGAYSYNLQQREGIVGLTLYYRQPIGRVTPYIGVGPRLVFLQSEADGSAGSTPIHTSSEVSTKVGVGVPLGVGLRLGPGDLFVEAGLLYAGIDHNITGSSNTGALTVSLGYRFFL
ncbi:MAG: outer membrane beta-barrel protein [Myxococcales bacterium]|nr:outer membrane beta-barrel protein [Myxococcales bacterium]